MFFNSSIMVWHLLQIGHIKAKESRVSFQGFTSQSLKQVSNGNLFLLSVCDYVCIYNTISIEGNRLYAIWHPYLLTSVYVHESPNHFSPLNFFSHTHYFLLTITPPNGFAIRLARTVCESLKVPVLISILFTPNMYVFLLVRNFPFVRIAHSHSLLQLCYWDSYMWLCLQALNLSTGIQKIIKYSVYTYFLHGSQV